MSEKSSSTIQKIFYWALAAVILVPIIWGSIMVIQTRDMILADLQTLNTLRETAFNNIRPALLRYENEHKSFPDDLNKLVPEYIQAIPEVLLYKTADKTKYNSIDIAVKYAVTDSGAAFSFQRGYDHTPVVTYDVLSNSYSDKTDLVAPQAPVE